MIRGALQLFSLLQLAVVPAPAGAARNLWLMGFTIPVPPGTFTFVQSLEPLLSIKQVTKILNISEKTLRDWVWRKKIDYVKNGDRVMFEPAAIRAYIAGNRVKAKQPERVM
jgi:excisionase family DNA binding protein